MGNFGEQGEEELLTEDPRETGKIHDETGKLGRCMVLLTEEQSGGVCPIAARATPQFSPNTSQVLRQVGLGKLTLNWKGTKSQSRKEGEEGEENSQNFWSE